MLDVGTGTGEHTILLAGLGYEVLGVDIAPLPVEQARAKAAESGVAARFEVADALATPGGHQRACFDTVLDSALFHNFTVEDRVTYVRVMSPESPSRPGRPGSGGPGPEKALAMESHGRGRRPGPGHRLHVVGGVPVGAPQNRPAAG